MERIVGNDRYSQNSSAVALDESGARRVDVVGPPKNVGDNGESPISAMNYWLTTEEVSKRLNIPQKTLANWASLGKGPRFARMGRHRRYRLSDLINWEEKQVESGGGA
ncbi:helix-turn-helix domain-containing protein [Nocardia cerradoensis]|uniref:helix-turn-helix domain-containing protein n=1 Tax=Nocardia cerradoensis TaxID=85688 RepID=UPI001CB9D063|nr:helix-turn-helix domain-containing protein [Nocardia cerradoensis]